MYRNSLSSQFTTGVRSFRTSLTTVRNAVTSTTMRATPSIRTISTTSSSIYSSNASHYIPHSRHFSTAPTDTKHMKNLAIIAHVDHGKTTLVDCLLRSSLKSKQLGTRVMDHNALEKERGITILSKCTGITWTHPTTNEEYSLTIVDTPGHADFGGEVERILSMVEGVCLVVDATDGPMTQTKFVTSKALKMGLRPIVVINKVDRPSARIGDVENEIFDLFVNLQATDEQMEFPIVYACAKEGWSTMEGKKVGTDMTPLFETIINYIPSPKVERDAPFTMLVTQIEMDPFMGKLLLGRITSGTIKVGDKMIAMDSEGKRVEETKIMKLYKRKGLDQVAIEQAFAGDIVSVAGFSNATVNYTLAAPSVTKHIESTPIDPPTLSMHFSPNDSPFQGTEGTQFTSSVIKARLMKEAESNVSMQIIETESRESVEVRGRGELQLGILIETMRREGFELSISAPKVVFKDGENKEKLEPLEEVLIDVPQDYSGQVIEKMSSRKGELLDFTQTDDGKARLKFLIPMRGLIGYRSELQNDTRGQGILNNTFHSYVPYMGEIDKSSKGAIVSSADGVITSFALDGLDARGTLFVEPGMKTYPGMVIGESNRDSELEVNPAKQKALSNVRSVSKEDKVKLTPPKIMSLEEVIAYVRDDEIIEVTPKCIRLRKKELDAGKRKAAEKARAARAAAAKEASRPKN